MYRSFPPAALIFLALSLSACQAGEQPPQRGAIDTAAIKASIDSLGGVVQKAHETKDRNLLAGTWAEDGILVMAGQPPVRGREAVVTALSSLPPLPPGGKMTIHPIDIQVMGPEWAYVLGVDSLKYTLPGAEGETVQTSTFLVLVRKTAEGWQTYRETLTPNEPAEK